MTVDEDAIIRVTELTRRFGKVAAVDRVSFTVGRGSIFGVFGLGGAGKTTLLRLLLGQIEPSAGRALILGLDAATETARLRRHVGYMAQRVLLYPDLTLVQNLRLVAGVHNLPAAESRARFFDLCERLDIDRTEAERQPAGRLAKGVQHRAGLAFAFLHRPEVLLLDEPTSAMDEHDQFRLWEILQEAAAAGTVVLLTSHHPEEAEYCERLVLLDEGQVRVSGTVPEIKARHVGGTRVRLEAPPWHMPLIWDRLQVLGYRMEPFAGGDEEPLRVLLEDYSEAHLRRLRAVLESLPVSPVMRLDLPSVEQVFREVLRSGPTR